MLSIYYHKNFRVAESLAALLQRDYNNHLGCREISNRSKKLSNYQKMI